MFLYNFQGIIVICYLLSPSAYQEELKAELLYLLLVLLVFKTVYQ